MFVLQYHMISYLLIFFLLPLSFSLSRFAYMVGDLEDESNISPKYPAPTTFEFSPWVGDDIMRLFPTYSVYKSGQPTPLSCNAPKLTRMTNTAAHQMYQVITRCGGLVFEFYAHMYHSHPVVEWELMGIFSDYSVSDVEIDIDRIDLTFGEFFKVDDSVPLGLSSSTGTYNQADDTFTTSIVTNTYIGHGQGTPVYKGALLCLPNTATFLDNIRNQALITSPEWNVLLSRLDGTFMAGRTHWDDSWLAFQAAVPRHAGDDSLLDWQFNDQYNMMSSPQDLWEQRKLGLFYNAGSTGMQRDFGSHKGTQATHGDLRFTLTWHYHLQESMRPFHYREADGSKTTGDTQSNWVTWSQITHYHPSVSPNQLGKPAWQAIPSHNWSGKDDQHKSSNALNAAVATMDWPVMRSILQDEINVALENVRFLPNQDPGAPRAIGRRMLADANAYLLTGDEEVWTGLVLWHATNALLKSHVGHETDPNNFNYMRVSEVSTGNKPPFLCSSTTNCVQNVHEPLPKVFGWQHGLLLKGVVAAWNVHLYRQSLGLPTLPGTDDLETFLVEVSSTVVRHFYAQVNGNWQTWNLIAWNNGHPIPTSFLSANTPTAGQTHDLITVTNSWWDWHFAPLHYLARANHGLNLPSDVVTRLDSMATETEGMLATADFTRREWYPWTDVV